jgi:acetyltransferase-like isoleucine patch superfamily enzyme
MLLSLLLLFFPSFLKICILRALGAHIGKNSFIGFSLVYSEKLWIGHEVYIGHFNLIWRLKSCTLESGSRIGMFNWITGARTGSFSLGRNSAITRFHFFESSADIDIGHDSIIAGRNSHFFTHGISPSNLDDMRPIRIGNWCYIGSGSRFIPGSGTSDHVFVGMGSVVTKRDPQQYVMIAGAPAVQRKELSSSDVYFSRPFLPHSHHSLEYRGE